MEISKFFPILYSLGTLASMLYSISKWQILKINHNSYMFHLKHFSAIFNQSYNIMWRM